MSQKGILDGLLSLLQWYSLSYTQTAPVVPQREIILAAWLYALEIVYYQKGYVFCDKNQ